MAIQFDTPIRDVSAKVEEFDGKKHSLAIAVP